MAAWGVNGEATGAHLNTWGRTQGHGNTVKGIVDFVDNTGIPVYLSTDKTIGFEKRDDRQGPAAQIGAASKEMGKVTYKAENVDKALTNLKTVLNGTSEKYDLAKVKAALISKGISLEALDRLGTQGLTGDALIEAALKEAGIDSKECFSTSYNDKLAAFDKAGTELKTALAAYNANKNPTTLAALIKARDNHETARGALGTPAPSLEGDKKEVWTKTADAISAAQTPTTTTPARTAPAPVAAKQPAPPQGLNDNGRAIWLFVFNQTGKRLDITATQKIAQDGVIDQKEAGEVGINMVVFDGVDNGMLDSTTRAAGATVGDRKLDATELAHYNTVVKELAQRTGRSETEIYAAYQTAKYLVNVDLREVSSRIDNLSGLIRGGKIDFAKIQAGDTAEIERLKTLIGKDVHVDIINNLVEQIKAGRVKNADEVNKYFFNAMMGSLTGEFKFWGVADFGNLPNIGRYTPRAGKSGDDLSTWLRTGKSPEAEGTSGTAGSGDEESIRKAQIARARVSEAENGDEAKTRFEQAVRENKLQANDKEALIEIAKKYASKQEWEKLVTFASRLDPAIRDQFYGQALETIQRDFTSQMSNNKLDDAEKTTKQLEELIVKMGEDGNKYKPEANKMRLQLSLKYADANNKDKAYTIINAIPVGGEITWKDGDQSRSLSRNEARFMVAEKFHDSTPMNEVIADATSPATDKALANIYLAKIKGTPKTKAELEAVLKDYTKAAEAIKADTSPKANALRERIRGEMRQAVQSYQQNHTTESAYAMQQLIEKYINKMPEPASTPATTTPTTGRTGGPGTSVKPGTTDKAKAAADGATG
ncbi:MAG: hypothetical protein WC405_19110 [Syntrophales bacterium]